MSVPRFWREIPQRYNLQASRCGVCQAIAFPPRVICTTCRRSSVGNMESMHLSGRGRLLEWTRVHKPAPGYAMQVPYIIALIQSDEGPVITGQLVHAESASLQSGLPVQAVFRRLGQDGDAGVIYYGTKWRLTTDAPQASETKPARRGKTVKKKGKGRKKQ